ncbi:MAG TPA: ATP-binding protein [Alphaproteobacteria bacterium]|nr:ATP-binding protein [Alphaproteobacteria bacterium]
MPESPPSPSPAQPQPAFPEPLPASALYRRCDPARLGFATTAELEPLDDAPGQPRALEALQFGLGIRRGGYNLFAIGPAGTGKRTIIDQLTRKRAAAEPTPQDWVYVYNFGEPHKPQALSLPAGRGTQLRQDVRTLIDELRAALPAAFESDDYRTRRKTIDAVFKERQDHAFQKLQRRAKEHDIAVIRTPVGIGLAPMRNGEVMEPEGFNKLPAAEQERLQTEMTAIHKEFQAILEQAPKWESERREKIRELNHDVTRFAIGFRFDALRQRYADLPHIVEHLKVAEHDLVENAEQFLAAAQSSASEVPTEIVARHLFMEQNPYDRYQVNLLVDHSKNGGAPVIEEDHPTLQNLVGRVEYKPQFGNLVTDFTLIKPGALHMANGGYLLLDARRVLMQPFAWEELKRALRASEIQIRSVAEMVGMLSTVTLEPAPIPLHVKVVLSGDRQLYYLLAALDPDFQEMFKVAADFDDEVDRTGDAELSYARLIASITKREKIRPLDCTAVARVVEHAARIAGDSEKVTARLEMVADLLREADHLAAEAGSETITAVDIQRTIDLQVRRASRVRERVYEEIRRGTILIDTTGSRIGQVNGLSVLQLGGFMFGQPSRISARIRLGKGEVVDIEREVELGGPIHSKGVLILAGFLGGRFGIDRPLALSASIVFEQSYGGVEGDSASMAELCAILSALAAAPIRQGIAITGSVNQNGDAQAIGGVNEKIEGFFDVCRAAGLSGEQGVIIPASNVKHLMLRQDVVEAAAAGRFRIIPVRTVDEAMAALTGVAAGARDASGTYAAGSINQRVEAELIALAERAKSFATPERKANAP